MEQVEYSIIKLPHGYFNGGIYETNYIPTIDTGVGCWHILIGERKMQKVKSCDCVGMLKGGKWDNYIDSARRVYSTEQASPTRTTCGGGHQEVKIVEPTALDEQNGYLRKDGTVGTIVTDGSPPKHNNRIVEPNLRIRKLTPRECFRLMGVKDEDFERVAKNQSKSSLYHLAGDSIITNCLMAIFKEML